MSDKPGKKRKVGRPPEEVPQDVADKIVERIENGEFLSVICREDGMPHRSTVYDWEDKDEEFSRRIARARARGGHVRAERVVELARQPTDSAVEVQRRKLEIDTEFRALSKWFPSDYGDRIEHTGTVTLEQLVSQSREAE